MLGYNRVDLSIPTVACAMTFEHTYASRATTIYTSNLGYGWTHNQDIRLTLPASPGGQPGLVWFKGHSTNQYEFSINTDGSYTPYPGVLAALSYATASNSYVLTLPNQARYTFDVTGKLTQRSDPAGRVLNYVYYQDTGLLHSVTEPLSQASLTFVYDAQGHLISVSDHAGPTCHLRLQPDHWRLDNGQ